MKSFFLIGFRGAGKTTLGKKIAGEKSISFLDLDGVFEERHKTSILAYIDEHGLERFRREEEKILRETAEQLQNQDKAVAVATGGGFVDWAPSVELMASVPFHRVYLDFPPEVLWDRISGLKERQIVCNLHDYHALLALWKKRDPLFRRIATHRIQASGVEQALQELSTIVS